MKYSTYNSIIELNDRLSVLHCAFTDNFVVFRNKLRPSIEKLTPVELQKEAPILYDELIKGGAIIDDDRDEFEELKIIGKEIANSKQEYKLTINPTMDCNFKCWYCYETHVPGSEMNVETIDAIKLLINNISQENEELKYFDISFFGGEPLLCYENVIKPIINHIRNGTPRSDIKYSISFTTNGYLINDDQIKHLAEGDEENHFQITLDGAREQHNKVRNAGKGNDSYKTIVDNISKLLRNKMHVILRINYSKYNIQSLSEILPDILRFTEEERQYLKVSLHRVWQDDEVRDYESSIIESVARSFKDESFMVTDRYSMNDFRYPCYADKKQTAVINYNGDVYKCTARDYSSENRLGIITPDGVIVWNDGVDNRNNFKFNREICRECSILPLCGGGCSQKAIESAESNVCTSGIDENYKNRTIKQRFINRFVG